MTNIRVVAQPAFIMQHRPYRETSILMDLLTYDYGMVSVLAKGVRTTKSKIAGLLLPFQALSVTFSGANELKTLNQVESPSPSPSLTGLSLYCGFYLNELLQYFCHKHDPYPELYRLYQQTLLQLQQSVNCGDQLQLEVSLRWFEWHLLHQVGLGLVIDQDACAAPIKSEARYQFHPEQGAFQHSAGQISGSTLQALQQGNLTDKPTLREAKKLLRGVLHFHLQGKPLKSRQVLAKIYPQF